MDFAGLQSIANGGAISGFQTMGDSVPIQDTSEEININPLALLKMLKHARHGVPFEVMGLMLG
jgi:26S proteasome regulatory subunit N11